MRNFSGCATSQGDGGSIGRLLDNGMGAEFLTFWIFSANFYISSLIDIINIIINKNDNALRGQGVLIHPLTVRQTDSYVVWTG